ncbi:MAG: oligosaccharide flippase family protein [Nitrospira sp.]|nr:oligosaccharide flippase family protein [Nitrospira sp.]
MRKALKSIFVVWAGMLLGAGLSFLTQAFLARALSLPEYGLFAAINNFILVVTPLAGLGLGNYWLKKFGQHGWGGITWVEPSLKLLLWSLPLGLFLVLLIGRAMWPDSTSQMLLLLLLPLMVMQAFSSAASARFQLEERYTALAIWKLVPVLAKFAVAGFTLAFALGLKGLAIGLCFSMTLIGFSGFYYAYSLVSGQISLAGHGNRFEKQGEKVSEYSTTKSIFREVTPFALGSFFGLIYLQSDIFILSFLVGNEDAGLYNAAFAVMAAIYFLPGAIFNQYLLPKYHRWSGRDEKMLLDVFRFGNAAMLITGVCIMIGVVLLSPYVVPWIFGQKFQETSSILIWLSLCIPLRFISSSVEGVLVTKDNMKRKVFYQGVIALLNIAFNFLLIPIYQAYGAVMSTVASEFLLLVMYLFGAQKYVFHTSVIRGWHLNSKVFNR